MNNLLKEAGFHILKTNTLNIIVQNKWENSDLIKLMGMSPRELLSQSNILTKKLPTVPSTTVIRVSFKNYRLYFKFFHISKFSYKIRDTIRHTKAEKALQGSLLIKKAGLRTPDVVAIAHRRGLKKTSHILLITNEVEGISLRLYSREYQIPREKRIQIAYNLGKDIATMHKHLVSHGDLHPGNILLDKKKLNFFYLDTERVKKTHTKFNKYMLKDLSLLNHPNLGCFSKEDRLIFIRSYFNELKENIPFTLEEFIKQIHYLSNKRYIKNDQK